MSLGYDPKNDGAALTIARRGLELTFRNWMDNQSTPTYIQSNDGAPGAVTIATNGGTGETILISCQQGSADTSIDIVSAVGGVTIAAHTVATLSSSGSVAVTAGTTTTITGPTSVTLTSSGYHAVLTSSGAFSVPSLAVISVNSTITTGTFSNSNFTAANSGTVFRIDTTGAVIINLPSPSSVCAGFNYKFFVTAAGSTLLINANNIYGVIIRSGGVSTKSAATTIGSATAVIGDYFSFVCDGTNWYVNGITSNVY